MSKQGAAAMVEQFKRDGEILSNEAEASDKPNNIYSFNMCTGDKGT